MTAELKDNLNRTGFNYLSEWFIEPEEVVTSPEGRRRLEKIIDIANRVIPAVAELPESIAEGRSGAVVVVYDAFISPFPIAIAVNEEFKPDKEFGDKENKHAIYGLGKLMVAVQDPDAFGSRNNNGKMNINGSDLPPGSVVWRGKIVSVSGFNPAHIDESAALAIHVGIGNMTPDEASELAIENLDNTDFPQRLDIYLEPIYH